MYKGYWYDDKSKVWTNGRGTGGTPAQAPPSTGYLGDTSWIQKHNEENIRSTNKVLESVTEQLTKMQTTNKQWKQNFDTQLKRDSDNQKESTRRLQETIASLAQTEKQGATDTTRKPIVDSMRNEAFDAARYLQQQNRQKLQAGLISRAEAEDLMKRGLLRPEDVYGKASNLPAGTGKTGTERSENLKRLSEQDGLDVDDLEDALRQRSETDVRVHEWELGTDPMPVELLEPVP